MKNINLIQLAQSLAQLGNLTGQKFSYCVARNLNLLKPKLKEYEESRLALLESMAKKGKDKKPIMENVKDQKDAQGNPVQRYVLEDEEAFSVELKKLNEEEVDVKLFMLDLKDVPQEITTTQMSGVIEIIKEETPKPTK